MLKKEYTLVVWPEPIVFPQKYFSSNKISANFPAFKVATDISLI